MERPERPSRPEKVCRNQGFLRHRTTRLRIISSDSDSENEIELLRPSRVHNSHIASTSRRLWETIHGVDSPTPLEAAFISGLSHPSTSHLRESGITSGNDNHPHPLWPGLVSLESPQARSIRNKRQYSHLLHTPSVVTEAERRSGIRPNARPKRHCPDQAARSLAGTSSDPFDNMFMEPRVSTANSGADENSVRIVDVHSLMNENEMNSNLNETSPRLRTVAPVMNLWSLSSVLPVEHESRSTARSGSHVSPVSLGIAPSGSSTAATNNISGTLPNASEDHESAHGNNNANSINNTTQASSSSNIIILTDPGSYEIQETNTSRRYRYPELNNTLSSPELEDINRSSSHFLRAISDMHFTPSRILDNLNASSYESSSTTQTVPNIIASANNNSDSNLRVRNELTDQSTVTATAAATTTTAEPQLNASSVDDVIILQTADDESELPTETLELDVDEREQGIEIEHNAIVASSEESADTGTPADSVASAASAGTTGPADTGSPANCECVGTSSIVSSIEELQLIDSCNASGHDGPFKSLIPNDFHMKMMSLLECPVCLDVIIPPINQCKQGHPVCATCRPKLHVCPTCRSRFSDYRNIIMEKVADLLLFPCKNSSLGCTDLLHYTKKVDHEVWCNYRQYNCVVPVCNWFGFKQELVVHMTNEHPQRVIVGNDEVFKLVFESNTETRLVMAALNEVFTVTFIMTGGNLKGIVRYLGDFKKAKNFMYKITFRGKHNGQELIWKERTYPDSNQGSISTLVECSLMHTIFRYSSSNFTNSHNISHVDVQVSIEEASNSN